MSEISFVTDFKPLFREKDREAMIRSFDLRSHDDVSEHAEAIVEQLRDGSMPCDEPWPVDEIDLFGRWIESGKAA